MKMKKTLILILTILTLVLSGCSIPKDPVLDSLGKYTDKEYYSDAGFQDSTDYAKYSFDNAKLDGNKYLEKMSAQGKDALLTHVENFGEWIDAIKGSDPDAEIAAKYDFDASIISDDDYLYIDDDPDYPELGCYDVYFFDSESMTLYYFHVNI